ncbi:MAG: hypothetical protein KDA99_12080 [Planctomycetales bacterium]|nr:hypothetical protein [Planctomycetales bacterium]
MYLPQAEKHTSSTVREILDELVLSLDTLLQGTEDSNQTAGSIGNAKKLIAALPLATDDFCTASNRMRNAVRYFNSGERGAAKYELRLLLASLRNNFRQ